MTTTELIKILQDNETGAISLKPREISLTINDRYMPNPQITLSSTGDGICGAEIDLDINGEWLEQEPCGDTISRQHIIDTYKSCADMFSDDELKGADTVMEWVYNEPPVNPQEPKWIPVSERLPKAYQKVLVTYEEFHWANEPATYGVKVIPFGGRVDFIAWMPLPEPYKGESEE